MKFKESTVELDDGEGKVEVIPVREISARGRMELFDLYKSDANPVLQQATAVLYGCPQYADADIDEILDSITGEAIEKMSKEILEISGLGEQAAQGVPEKN